MKANGRLAVDTNAVIAYREGISTVCNLINMTDIILLPAVVLGELMYGALNSAKPEENEEDITKFADNSVLIPIDEAVALRYARVRSDLRKMGRPIPENDIWIAAICLELNVPLMSSDGHFDNIRDLKVVNWTK